MKGFTREDQLFSLCGLTPEEEYARFDAARVKAQEQLGALYEKALGAPESAIMKMGL